MILILCVFVQLSNSVDRYINNFQIVDNLSDRGSLIIHLFKVTHQKERADLPVCIQRELDWLLHVIDLRNYLNFV